MTPRLFVYGTLRPAAVAFAPVLAPYVVEHRPGILRDHALYAVGLPYPAITPKAGFRVVGDLVTLDSGRVVDAFAAIDLFEGDGYRRAVVTVEAGGEQLAAWVYLAAEPGMLPADALVRSGDWFECLG